MKRIELHNDGTHDLKVTEGETTPKRPASARPTPPPRGLTVPFLRGLATPDEPFDLSDFAALGLRVRVNRDGSKVFRYTANVKGGGQRVITIGTWGEEAGPGVVTLDAARDYLTRLKAANRAGTLEAEAARVAFEVRAPVTAHGLTVRELSDEFYKRAIVPHRKRPEDALYALDGHIKKHLGDVPVQALTTPQLGKFLDAVVDGGAKRYAATVLQLLKQMLDFAVARGYITASPAAPMRAKHHGVLGWRRGDRALSVKELPLFMQALAATHYPEKTGKLKRGQNRKHPAPELKTRLALKLILLTACRPGEVVNAEWSEVDLDEGTWTIPPAKQKLSLREAENAKPFVVTLSPQAVAVLRELEKLRVKKNPFVVPGEVEGQPLSDKVLGRTLNRMQEKDPPLLKLPGGRVKPHDLRRTARTLLGEVLEVEPAIAERCLNHSLGKMTTTYDKGQYLDRRREAMNRLGALVMPAT